MRLFLISSFIFILININKAISDVLPNDLFSSVEVVELQMSSLQTNSIKNNSGIYQCWLFAHPENKRYTGPFGNFKKMISDTSYNILLNSTKFKSVNNNIVKPKVNKAPRLNVRKIVMRYITIKKIGSL